MQGCSSGHGFEWMRMALMLELLLSSWSDTVGQLHHAGPGVMRHWMTGPLTDVVLSGNLIGSQT